MQRWAVFGEAGASGATPFPCPPNDDHAERPRWLSLHPSIHYLKQNEESPRLLSSRYRHPGDAESPRLLDSGDSLRSSLRCGPYFVRRRRASGPFQSHPTATAQRYRPPQPIALLTRSRHRPLAALLIPRTASAAGLAVLGTAASARREEFGRAVRSVAGARVPCARGARSAAPASIAVGWGGTRRGCGAARLRSWRTERARPAGACRLDPGPPRRGRPGGGPKGRGPLALAWSPDRPLSERSEDMSVTGASRP